MMETSGSSQIGYAWLAERFRVATLPYWRESWVLVKGARHSIEREGRQIEYLPAVRDPGDDLFAQLEFALKREGLHLELLRKTLPQLEPKEVADHVRSKPTGRYARVIWWLYEDFAQVRLELPDLEVGNYVDLLDDKIYVTGPVRKVKRQRINVNLLGTLNLSPMVRWKGLGAWNESDLKKRCEEIVDDYPPEIFHRAVRYLYAKESKSSHEIEREMPDHKRAEKFIDLLQQAWHRDFITKPALVELQNSIVDPRYANRGWRSGQSEGDRQVYIGETLAPGHQQVHYVAPKPEDLDALMGDFIPMAWGIIEDGFDLLDDGSVPPPAQSVPTLVAAALISFLFNFLHPFSDGNGRIHRFLLHHVLARRGFGPEGIILPVSAVILNRPRDYDRALESFSKPLMKLVEYTMDDRLRMTVTNDTVDFYRYIDCTELTRITIDFIRETIETELPTELRYLASYDKIRTRMREVVDFPDRHADLFIKLVRQNGGTLSAKKRKLDEFEPLTDAEITAMETTVREQLELGESSSPKT